MVAGSQILDGRIHVVVDSGDKWKPEWHCHQVSSHPTSKLLQLKSVIAYN